MPQGYFDTKTGRWVSGAPTAQAPAKPLVDLAAEMGKPVPVHKQSVTAQNRRLPTDDTVKNPNIENLKELLKATGKAGATAGGAALSLYGGTLPHWLARMATVGAGGAIQAAGREEDISAGAGSEMLMEGLATGMVPKAVPGLVRRYAPRLFNDPTAGPGVTGHFLTGGLSELFPYLGHRGALFASGAHTASKGGNRDVANAAIDLRNNLNIGGVELGNIKQNKINLANPNSARRRAEATGRALEAAETGSTKTIPVRHAFEGVTNEASEKATTGGLPLDRIVSLKRTERDYVIDQAVQAELRKHGLDISSVDVDTAEQVANYLNNPVRRRNIWNNTANSPNLDMRGLGNMRRRARAEADDLISARASSGANLAENRLETEFYDSIYNQSKKLQESMVPELKGINKTFSDLFKVEEAMGPVRGMERSQLGPAGVRGGLGQGLGSNMQTIFPATSGLAKFFAPMAVFLGAPPALTKGGGLFGTAANMAPSAARLTDLATAGEEGPSSAVSGPLGATFEDPEMRSEREKRQKEQEKLARQRERVRRRQVR